MGLHHQNAWLTAVARFRNGKLALKKEKKKRRPPEYLPEAAIPSSDKQSTVDSFIEGSKNYWLFEIVRVVWVIEFLDNGLISLISPLKKCLKTFLVGNGHCKYQVLPVIHTRPAWHFPAVQWPTRLPTLPMGEWHAESQSVSRWFLHAALWRIG